jgi:hypothetical protein
MQRCRGNEVNAVGREVMWRRVRPILAHKLSIIGPESPCKLWFHKAMRGRIALQKHCVLKLFEDCCYFVPQSRDFRSARSSSPRFGPIDPTCCLDIRPPRPACGERIEVRGLWSGFSEAALATRVSPRESRSLVATEGNRHRAHSLAAFTESKFCWLQVSPPAPIRLLHLGLLLSGGKACNRIRRWRP